MTVLLDLEVAQLGRDGRLNRAFTSILILCSAICAMQTLDLVQVHFYSFYKVCTKENIDILPVRLQKRLQGFRLQVPCLLVSLVHAPTACVLHYAKAWLDLGPKRLESGSLGKPQPGIPMSEY